MTGSGNVPGGHGAGRQSTVAGQSCPKVNPADAKNGSNPSGGSVPGRPAASVRTTRRRYAETSPGRSTRNSTRPGGSPSASSPRPGWLSADTTRRSRATTPPSTRKLAGPSSPGTGPKKATASRVRSSSTVTDSIPARPAALASRSRTPRTCSPLT